MEEFELILKCIKGIYLGKFLYLNSLVISNQEQEIIGSGTFENNGVTAAIQDASLEAAHLKIIYKDNFYLNNLSTSKGTWIKINPHSNHILHPNHHIKIDKHIFTITELDILSQHLIINTGRIDITINKKLTISTKQPTDFVFPSLYTFSIDIELIDDQYRLIVNQGNAYYNLIDEIKLNPGIEFQIGTLEFEVCRYNYGRFSSIGLRPTMEDADVIIQNLFINSQPVSYYAIFDGHGGNKCSIFLKENLHVILQRMLNGITEIAD